MTNIFKSNGNGFFLYHLQFGVSLIDNMQLITMTLETYLLPDEQFCTDVDT